MDKDGNQKWGSLLVEIPNPNKTYSRAGMGRKELVPKAFVIVSGQKTREKIELCNAMLCDWQVELKIVKKPKKGKTCPYYALETQNTNIRAFYSHMRKEYGWDFTEHNFKGWKGCLDGVLEEVYGQRLKEYVSTRLLCIFEYSI